MTESLTMTAIRELGDVRCACGAEKQRNQSFCRGCYFALPAATRSKLYAAFSQGYAEVYDEAKDWLRTYTARLERAPQTNSVPATTERKSPVKKQTSLFIALLIFAVLAAAPCAQAKPWYRDKGFWFRTALRAGFTYADYASTASVQSRGGVELTNPFLGARPSTRRIIGVGIADFVGTTALDAAVWHVTQDSKSKYWRFAGRWSVTAEDVGAHAWGVARNYSLPRDLR